MVHLNRFILQNLTFKEVNDAFLKHISYFISYFLKGLFIIIT